jgi:arsenate reductase
MMAFRQALSSLENRVSIFVSLPIESLDRLKLQRKLDEIGRTSPQVEDAADSA